MKKLNVLMSLLMIFLSACTTTSPSEIRAVPTSERDIVRTKADSGTTFPKVDECKEANQLLDDCGKVVEQQKDALKSQQQTIDMQQQQISREQGKREESEKNADRGWALAVFNAVALVVKFFFFP